MHAENRQLQREATATARNTIVAAACCQVQSGPDYESDTSNYMNIVLAAAVIQA